MLVLSVEFQLILMEFAYFSETNIEIAILCFRRGSVPKWVAEQSIRYGIPFFYLLALLQALLDDF